jgi:two-component system chemotaxis response regulator CheY
VSPPRRAPAALVVDDSAAMRRQLCLALEGHLHTLEAGDGAEAWRTLQSRSVDLILTDVNMPLLDGLKLIGLVRSGGAHQRTPIVVITSEAAEADRRRAERLGADAYLVKPVVPDKLVATVQRLLAGA